MIIFKINRLNYHLKKQTEINDLFQKKIVNLFDHLI